MGEAMWPYVVAGVDGSPPSVTAAGFAADWAVRGGWDLHLVHGFPPAALQSSRRTGEELLRRVADEVRRGRGGLNIVCRRVAGDPAAILADESRWAEVTVVGSRGQGPLAAAVLGSVAATVAAHAAGPVIVVRPPEQRRATTTVLVGVDGSDGGAQALGFAFPAAQRSGGPLVALHVWWANPVDTLRNLGQYVPAEVEAAAGRLLADAIQPWREKYPDVRVVEKLVHSLNPAEELIDESAGAGLVVVGPRGHGAVAGVLLGSVTSSVVRQAHCPVAVARAHSHRAG